MTGDPNAATYFAILEGATIEHVEGGHVGDTFAVVLLLDNGWRVKFPLAEPGIEFGPP